MRDRDYEVGREDEFDSMDRWPAKLLSWLEMNDQRRWYISAVDKEMTIMSLPKSSMDALYTLLHDEYCSDYLYIRGDQTSYGEQSRYRVEITLRKRTRWETTMLWWRRFLRWVI